MIKPNHYYAVQGWMITELALKGNELAAYAIIYGFSQDGRSTFSGSLSYVMEWLSCSRQTAVNVLNGLVEKGLVQKIISRDGVTPNSYTVLPPPPRGSQNIGLVKNLDESSQNIRPEVVKNLDEGSQNIRPNNNTDNYLDIYINNNIYSENKNSENKDEGTPPPPPPKEEKKKRGRPKKGEAPPKYRHGKFNNVLLTEEELRKLQELYPDTWQERIDDLSFGLETKGYKYKSHYAVILSWDRTDKKRAKQNAQAGQTGGRHRGPNGIAIDQSKNDLDGVFAG